MPTPEGFSNQYPKGHEGDDRYLPYGINPDGKSQSELAAARDEAVRKTQADLKGPGGPEEGKGPNGNDKTYYSPGSADVGGYVGGAKDQSDMYKSGAKDNAGAIAQNDAAQKLALANMKSNRGTVSPENATLLARQDQARGVQGNALDMSRDAAMGNAPSAADAGTAMQMNDNMAGQAGAMGSAHGLAGLGGTQAIGAQGLGMAGTQAAGQGALGRSAEVNGAIGQYGQAAGVMAQGDINRLNQGDKNSVGNAQLNDAWTEGNANLAVNQGKLGLAQHQTNDAWYNQSEDPYKRQMQYDSRMNAMENGASADSADAINAKHQADTDRNKQIVGGAVQGGLTIAGTAFGGPVGGLAGGTLGGMANSQIQKSKWG